MSNQTIKSSDEAWDERELGADEASVEVVDAKTAEAIDEAAGTKLISIRLQKSLIEDLKMIGAVNNGIGYQTLAKQILQRFVDCEKKRIFNEVMSARLEEQEKEESRETGNHDNEAA